MEKHVRLCWTSDLGMGTFQAYLARKEFVDVLLVADDGVELHAHSIMLSACSSYFERILERFDRSKETPVILLPGAKGSELKALIHFIYYGEVGIPQAQYDSFLKLAQLLEVRGLSTYPVDPSSGNNLGSVSKVPN